MLGLYYCNEKISMKVSALKWDDNIPGNTEEICFLIGSNKYRFEKNPFKIFIYDGVRKKEVELKKGDWLLWINNDCITVCKDKLFKEKFDQCGDDQDALFHVLGM